MEDFFLIAKIISVFSADGFVKIKSYSDFPERFFLLEKVYINIYGDYRLFIVEDVEQIEDFFILKFKNFDSDNDVEFLVGSAIFVQKNDAVSLEEDTFFIHDLIGCKVFFEKKFFGKIVDVLNLTSNDILVVKADDSSERLIPFVEDFVSSVDIEKKIVELKQDFDEFSDDEN